MCIRDRYQGELDLQSMLTSAALDIPYLLTMGVALSLVFGALAAMASFGYLYNNRSAAMMHALPLRREALFTTQYLAGLSCLCLLYTSCHIYVDQWANQTMALDIMENAKCSRPSVCNAAEVCLVHRAIAEEFLPKLRRRLTEDRAAAGLPPVELRLDRSAAAVIPGTPAGAVSYTHLDVYKRQVLGLMARELAMVRTEGSFSPS